MFAFWQAASKKSHPFCAYLLFGNGPSHFVPLHPSKPLIYRMKIQLHPSAAPGIITRLLFPNSFNINCAIPRLLHFFSFLRPLRAGIGTSLPACGQVTTSLGSAIQSSAKTAGKTGNFIGRKCSNFCYIGRKKKKFNIFNSLQISRISTRT
jgi:hypothetical protein